MHPDTGAAVYVTGVLPAELDHAHLAIPRISEIGSSLRVRRNQQLGRFPVHLQMSLYIVRIPAIEHFEQDFVDLLAIR